MAREKDPKRELAFKMYRENPSIGNKEIATILEVDENKIAIWKLRDKWRECLLEKGSKTTDKKKKTITKKKKYNITKTEKEDCNITEIEIITEKEEQEEAKTFDKRFLDRILNSDLTEKQKLFCVYYIQSFNATQSALKAGYSKESAYVEGHRLLKNAKIIEFVTELKNMQMEQLMLDGCRLLNRHAQIAFSDISDYLTEHGSLKPMSQIDGSLIKKIKIKSKSSEFEGNFEESKELSIELEDKSKSLEFLTKYFSLDPTFRVMNERIETENKKVEVLEERNRILEHANKPVSGDVKDMQKQDKLAILKKYGGG